jgi:hypothetical protein
MLGEELLVRCGIFIDADAQDGGALRRDYLLQADEGGGLFHARRAPSGPKIEDNYFAAEISECGAFPIEVESEGLGQAPRGAGLTLPVIGMGEEHEQRDDSGENKARQ